MKEPVAVHHLNLSGADARLLSITTHDGTWVYNLSPDQVLLLAYQAIKILWDGGAPSLPSLVGRMSAMLRKRPKCELTGCARKRRMHRSKVRLIRSLPRRR
jgi:hypothetical protein